MKAVTAEESDTDEAEELTAEELLTDETATAQELHSDEADELTITSTPELVFSLDDVSIPTTHLSEISASTSHIASWKGPREWLTRISLLIREVMSGITSHC